MVGTKTKLSIVAFAILVVAGLIYLSRRTVAYDEPTDTPRPIMGNADSAIVLQEFSDFQCPACGAAFPVVKDVMEKFGDRVRFEYKHFPLIQIHANAFNAAMASECANDQDKFWAMHDKLFENQTALSKADLKSYAQTLGLDAGRFNACLDSRAKADEVNADMKEGRDTNVNSTPTFFLNGTELEGVTALESALQTAVDQAGT